MAFVSKDWRDPGGIYIKSNMGHWESKKIYRLRIFETLHETYLKRAFFQSISENSVNNEVLKETSSGFYQPHIVLKNTSTKESIIVTTLGETLLALDFKVAIRDIRRIEYICRILQILIKDTFSSLSGQVQIYILDLLRDILQEVIKSKNYLNIMRMLLINLKVILENNKYDHVGSHKLWKNHCKSLEEMKLSLENISFKQIEQATILKFQDLPLECIERILLQLSSPQDFEMLKQTSSALHEIVDDNFLWKKLVAANFSKSQISSIISKDPVNKFSQCTWYLVYIRLLKTFGDSHSFLTKLAKCTLCASIFWPNFGHPCLSISKENVQYKVLSPEEFVNLFQI